MAMTREQAIERIKKLAAMTTSHGASEAEAAMATQKMSALVAEFDVQQSEIQVRAGADGIIEDVFTIPANKDTPILNSLGFVGKLFNCKASVKHVLEDVLDLGIPMKVTKVRFFGYPVDVSACIALTAIIKQAMDLESERYVRERELATNVRARKKLDRVSIRHSFEVGMSARLIERILDLIPKESPSGTSSGRGLIVLKQQLVAEEFAKRFPTMKIRDFVKAGDLEAFSRGTVAGDRVNLLKQGQIS